jgi:hypothetical protein
MITDLCSVPEDPHLIISQSYSCLQGSTGLVPVTPLETEHLMAVLICKCFILSFAGLEIGASFFLNFMKSKFVYVNGRNFH